MLDEVKERLQSFNITVDSADEIILNFIIRKIENTIKNATNQDAVPEELHYFFVDKVCGEFLFEKKNMGLLTEIEMTAAVKSIKEGKEEVVFTDSNSVEDRFDILVKSLTNDDNVYSKFRKLVW